MGLNKVVFVGFRDIVFRMACKSRHCICIDCFSNMCKQLLHTSQFRNFEGMGYSISCPGSGGCA